MSFEDLVIKGFNKWEGNYILDSQKVNVEVDVIRSKKNAININLSSYGDSCEVRYNSFGWTTGLIPTEMNLYAHFSKTLNRDWDNIINDAAHEFGHILGLGEAYKRNDGNFIQKDIIGSVI
jgi:hypothetical protein